MYPPDRPPPGSSFPGTGRAQVEVAPGQTLYEFAQKSLPPGSSHRDVMHMVDLIAQLNGIEDPNKIQAGQQLTMAQGYNPDQQFRPPMGRHPAPPGVPQSPALAPSAPPPGQAPAPGGAPMQPPDQATGIGPEPNVYYPPLQDHPSPIGPQPPPAVGSFSPSSGQPDFSQLAEDVHPLGLPPQGYGAALLAASGAAAPAALGMGAIGAGAIGGSTGTMAHSMFKGEPPDMVAKKGVAGALMGGGIGGLMEYGLPTVQGLKEAFASAPEAQALTPPPGALTSSMRAPEGGLLDSLRNLPLADKLGAGLTGLSGLLGGTAIGMGRGSDAADAAPIELDYKTGRPKSESPPEPKAKPIIKPRVRQLPVPEEEEAESAPDDEEAEAPAPARRRARKAAPRAGKAGTGAPFAQAGKVRGRQGIPGKDSKFFRDE